MNKQKEIISYPWDTYNAKKEMSRVKWETFWWVVAFLLLVAIFSPILPSIFADAVQTFNPLELTFMIFGLCFVACALFVLAYHEYEVAAIAIKIDDRGIFYWDEIKKEESIRSNFKDIKVVYWDPSRWYTFVTIIEKKRLGETPFKFYYKHRMEGQSRIKSVLKERAEEFHDIRLSDDKIRKLWKGEEGI